VLSEPLTGTYNTFYRGRKNNLFGHTDQSQAGGGGGLTGAERGWERDGESGSEDGGYDDRDQDQDSPPAAASLFQSFFNYVRL
jgi:hypothetical protein